MVSFKGKIQNRIRTGFLSKFFIFLNDAITSKKYIFLIQLIRCLFVSSLKGSSCTTPTGLTGKCAFINDPECIPGETNIYPISCILSTICLLSTISVKGNSIKPVNFYYDTYRTYTLFEDIAK